MKKILYLIATLALTLHLVSCGGVPNKSITEELTPEELNSLFKSVPEFERTYQNVESRRRHLSEATQKAQWYELTYKQFHTFLMKVYDEEWQEKNKILFEEEWDKEYTKYPAMVDSVSAYWKKYNDDNSLKSYVKIELAEIEKSNQAPAQFVLKITPLRGDIDEVEAYYDVSKKGGSPSFFYLHSYKRQMIHIKEKFASSQIRKQYPVLHLATESATQASNASELLKNYDFHYYVHNLVQDGKVVDNHKYFSNIPYSVRDMWEKEKMSKYSDFDRKWAIQRVSEEVLGKTYFDLSTYKYNRKKIEEQKIDKLAADFYLLSW